ncbi:hypothetical protein yberc0001_13230 [Yersinia bercovieri ATCC 43970]|uniref:Uncharacterized protein n=1 Tax=Yersinia bercovieri ATCC 43970 TaxID=349968 RepID=A0ABP2E2H3_YERBE|nr:hypothetical protein yberc0001_13230 [Yersinia bercovieri ATCC 43970]
MFFVIGWDVWLLSGNLAAPMANHFRLQAGDQLKIWVPDPEY